MREQGKEGELGGNLETGPRAAALVKSSPGSAVSVQKGSNDNPEKKAEEEEGGAEFNSLKGESETSSHSLVSTCLDCCAGGRNEEKHGPLRERRGADHFMLAGGRGVKEYLLQTNLRDSSSGKEANKEEQEEKWRKGGVRGVAALLCTGT